MQKNKKQTNTERNNMSTKLNVLVFDDTEKHRLAAKLQLAVDYNLTVVGTYDEAKGALKPKTDYDKVSELTKQGVSWKDACINNTTYPNFDIVLTDLLVPASDAAQGNDGMRFVGQEMSLGTTIALQALIIGIKKVAVVTDMNHHHHPASAAFDCIDGNECRLEGVNIICTNHVGRVAIDTATEELVDDGFLKTEEGKVKYPYLSGDYGDRRGLVYSKDWKRVLEKLTGKSKTE